MDIFLFSVNLKLAFFLAFLFLFIIPIFLIKYKNKKLVLTYLLIYLFMLLGGVLLKVSITNSNIYFSLLITNKWFNNPLYIASFAKLGIIINIFLLFPLGVIIPLLSTKQSKIGLKSAIYGMFASLLIETLQFSLPIRRFPELLDILNNTISVILGYMYYCILSKLLFRGEKYDRLSK